MTRAMLVIAAVTAVAWCLYLGIEGHNWLYGVSAAGLVFIGATGSRWWIALLTSEAVAVIGLALAYFVFWAEDAPERHTIGNCDPSCGISFGGGVILVTLAVLVLTGVGVISRSVYLAVR